MDHKFEQLMRPWRDAQPLARKRLTLPELWDRAKEMFARMIDAIGGDERVRARPRRSRKECRLAARAAPSAAARAGRRKSLRRPHKIARRVDALSRVLAKLEPVVRRLALFIASLPVGLLQPSVPDASMICDWRHGAPEIEDAGGHFTKLNPALYRIDPG